MTDEYVRRLSAVDWPDQDFEVRSVGNGFEFAGYAAVFNVWSADLGGFRERIMPGAFTKSINSAINGSADIKMFLNHDQGIVLGSTKARTLRLSQDDKGLLAEATLPDNEWGRPVRDAVRRGDISSMSFGFTLAARRSDGGPTQEYNSDRTERSLWEIRAHEVSPVTGWPAYGATTAAVRHLMSFVDWDADDAIGELVAALKEEQRDALRRHLAPAPATTSDPSIAELYARLERKGVAL